MDPLSLLLKPTNIIILLLLVASTVSGGIAYYYHDKNISLHEQIAVQKRDNQIYVETHNQQIALLTSTIDKQNDSIATFKQASDKQVQEMGKVQSKVDNMRITAEQQLAEMRKKPMAALTCDQSIDFLIQQSKVLTWSARK